jgi:hypothetical protein
LVNVHTTTWFAPTATALAVPTDTGVAGVVEVSTHANPVV